VKADARFVLLCIHLNLNQFSRFAALSGCVAVRKADWLPDPNPALSLREF
jgi:hypothetical protein